MGWSGFDICLYRPQWYQLTGASDAGVSTYSHTDLFMAAVLLYAGCFGLDIGPKTAAAFIAAMKSCRTLFWNGPMGRFEVPGFAQGTAAIAAAMGDATENGVTTVIGGG
eukprot:GHUV01037788.1.p2 GENE.GHUV01037788.1~~GHUV01037788.1.p2  ORF type:complete len:109 (-),score=20.54 GHUV01037788.1:476-802(-)